MISKKNIIRSMLMLPGWHTNRKILVIESDDWGSIRTKNKDSLKILSDKFPHFLKDEYTKYDSIESSEDLDALFEVLYNFKDMNGNPAIITANTIVANPDFIRIRNSGFKEYFYQAIDEEGFYKNSELNLIKDGINNKIYKPQLHGREHLNISLWLDHLNGGQEEIISAFNHEMFGIPIRQSNKKRNNVMAALDFETHNEINLQKIILTDAQRIFNRIFGYKSKTFISPSYIWHSDIEAHLKSIGVSALQGLPYQYIPNPDGKWYKTKIRYTSKGTNGGMINLVRNSFFEPSISKGQNTVLDCLNRINLAFTMKKPAIISSHRLNYIGGLDQENRIKTLEQLKELLKLVTEKWPDVEFMSSDELSVEINSGSLDREKVLL